MTNTMFKSFLGTLVVLSFILAPIQSTWAQEREIPSRSAQENRVKTEERRVEAVEKREEAREARIEVKEEKQENRLQTAKDRIKNHADLMIKRFENAINWLDVMHDRIESRINKFEEDGVNVDEAIANLALAKVKIDESGESVSNLKTAIEEALEGDDIKASLAEIRTLTEEAKNAIKEAHRALVNTIKNFKPGQNRDGAESEDNDEDEGDAS